MRQVILGACVIALFATGSLRSVGGCFTAHNVSGLFVGSGIRDFLAHLNTLPDAENTTIDRASREGIAITHKRAK